MEQNPGQTNQPIEPAPQQEQSIFDEAEILGSDYNKHVNRARNALFIIAGVLIINGLFASMRNTLVDMTSLWTELLIMAAIFVGLGLWSRKNPTLAITIGLVIFVLYCLALAVVNWENIIRGIIFKIFMIVYLITGLRNAQEAKRIKEMLNNK